MIKFQKTKENQNILNSMAIMNRNLVVDYILNQKQLSLDSCIITPNEFELKKKQSIDL